MFGRNLAEERERYGLASRALLQKGDVPGTRLTVTWVDVAPGSGQRLHYHDAEQVYVVLEGRGRMRVGDQEREVGSGDLVYVPSGAKHGIENASQETLVYVSAATPAMDVEAAYDTGGLRRDGREET
ncbi:cupin domain-containing protein [Rubrobacter marinus]|uniref:cupin domain-containing protein n=1 Tax=Rubrobacter marinus TaxID=2653852 RepID=UPI00140731D5|nr:cupin domain-containing protein [Rubrobacter marinus]